MIRTSSAAFLTAMIATTPIWAADVVVPQPSAPLTNPDSVYNWTGFYIGLGGGTGYLIDGLTVPAVGSTDISGIGGRGYFGQVQVGYDHLFSNGFVLGAAVSGRYGNVDTTWDIPGLNGSADADYGFDVIGRVGYAITPRTMAFLLAGYSWQHFEITPNSGASTDWSESGYVLGLGLETVLKGNWTWRSEYRYAEYGGSTLSDIGNVTVDPVTHTFHTNINYRFGGGASSVQRDPFQYNWAGLKLGAAVSVGVSHNEVTSPGGGADIDSLSTEGYLGELNVGYDWEFRDRWVAGVMLAGQYIDASSAASFSGYEVRADAGDFGFDAVLRGGYKFNDYTLGYVLGGYTYQELFASASFGGTTETRDIGVNALTLGTGTELALNERTSAYVEYRYTIYEDVNLGSLMTIEPTSHTIRVGAKFKLFE